MELISEIDNWQSRRDLRQRNGAGRKKNYAGGEHFDHKHEECAAIERKSEMSNLSLGKGREEGGILTAPELSLTFNCRTSLASLMLIRGTF